MSLSNTTENAALKMFCRALIRAIEVGATQYLALFTADPTESGSVANEANYTGYARVALTKATARDGWRQHIQQRGADTVWRVHCRQQHHHAFCCGGYRIGRGGDDDLWCAVCIA